tara:strand:+ start:466 stop:891 length:426 start_codon:yes stop_codon:yes gene_type:complete
MIFPEYQTKKDDGLTLNTDFGKEIMWDFKNGGPKIEGGDFVVVEGVDALRIWIEKALRTERFKWPIYKWSYGSEIERLLESQLNGQSMYQSLKQTIIDSLVHHPQISGVDGFKFERHSDKIQVTFKVKTILDDVLEVKWNV